MVKRRKISLKQAKRSLKAFFEQKASRRRKQSRRRRSKIGGNIGTSFTKGVGSLTKGVGSLSKKGVGTVTKGINQFRHQAMHTAEQVSHFHPEDMPKIIDVTAKSVTKSLAKLGDYVKSFPKKTQGAIEKAYRDGQVVSKTIVKDIEGNEYYPVLRKTGEAVGMIAVTEGIMVGMAALGPVGIVAAPIAAYVAGEKFAEYQENWQKKLEDKKEEEESSLSADQIRSIVREEIKKHKTNPTAKPPQQPNRVGGRRKKSQRKKRSKRRRKRSKRKKKSKRR
tara:strand:- start:259 stop:1095 length:837 start_codon:yes stop_codon:yes gene_type:complete